MAIQIFPGKRQLPFYRCVQNRRFAQTQYLNAANEGEIRVKMKNKLKVLFASTRIGYKEYVYIYIYIYFCLQTFARESYPNEIKMLSVFRSFLPVLS